MKKFSGESGWHFSYVTTRIGAKMFSKHIPKNADAQTKISLRLKFLKKCVENFVLSFELF